MSSPPYTTISTASAILRQRPDDLQARALYSAALCSLMLHHAASRFLGEPQNDLTGLIPWTSRRRRFAANLRAAGTRWPELLELERFWDARSHEFELHQASDGNFQILKLSIPNMWQAWMGGLIDHRAQFQSWTFDKSKTPLPPPMAFDGVGHGWFLLHAAQATERSFLSYSAALYVLEPDPVALAILFHLHDLQAILADPRLRLFTGPHAIESLTSALRQNRTWSIPQQFVTCRITPGGSPDLQSTCEALIAHRREQQQRLLAEVNARYAARGPEWWAARFSKGTPLRVLGLTTRYSTVLRWSMQELGQAIRHAGHDVEIVMEPDDQSLEDGLVEKLHEYDPDLLILISRMRHESPLLPRHVPFLCWDQDNLSCMRTPATTASLDAFTFVAGYGASHGMVSLGWPEKNCIPCFPAAAAHRYQPRALTPDESARYTCDFSFVSNASGSPEELHQQMAVAWKSSQVGATLFDELGRQIIARSRRGERFDHESLKAFVNTQSAAMGFTMTGQTSHEFIVAMRTLADRCFRHAALEWVAAYCRANHRILKLYGTGWEKHPILGAFACGRVDPGDAMTAIYLATRINLQIIESGLIHSRFLDGVAAGGFFLAREFMLPHERALADAQYALGTRAAELEIRDLAALDASNDRILHAAWTVMKDRYPHLTAEQWTPALRLWRELAPHYVALPEVEQITFSDEAGFAAMASRYLENETLRQTIAKKMRRAVLEKYSYDARWAQFLEGVRRGLISL